MYICTYICMCIYIHVCICIYVYIYRYIIHMRIHVYKHRYATPLPEPTFMTPLIWLLLENLNPTLAFSWRLGTLPDPWEDLTSRNPQFWTPKLLERGLQRLQGDLFFGSARVSGLRWRLRTYVYEPRPKLIISFLRYSAACFFAVVSVLVSGLLGYTFLKGLYYSIKLLGNMFFYHMFICVYVYMCICVYMYIMHGFCGVPRAFPSCSFLYSYILYPIHARKVCRKTSNTTQPKH